MIFRAPGYVFTSNPTWVPTYLGTNPTWDQPYLGRYWIEFAERGADEADRADEVDSAKPDGPPFGDGAETEPTEPTEALVMEGAPASPCVTPSKPSKAMQRKWSESIASEPDADSQSEGADGEQGFVNGR